MLKNLINNHWFWKQAVKKNRLLNSNIELVNSGILFSKSIFYILLFVKLTFMMFKFNEYIDLKIIDPLWSVFWVGYYPKFPWIAFFLVVSFLINTFILFSGFTKYFKFLLFFSCFILFSLLNSRGKINHSFHTVLIPLFCFIFLNSSEKKYKNFLIYASSVFSLLMSYFLAGFWKILKGFYHLYNQGNNIFNLDAFTRILKYQYRYEEPTVFATWIIENESIGFIMIWCGILLEFFSIFIFFFGKIHRIWGLALLFLHIFISIIMNVSFVNAFVTIIPLLILSPFSNKKTNFYPFR